jgi:cyclopropane fatty-acyl-phospholipid synthase-like methyltransferase
MSSVSFENYNRKAKDKNNSDIVVSGRYEFQSEGEKKIIPDVIRKLDVQSGDRILDIGCGPGLLLFPLSLISKEVCGIDNVSVINRINKKSKTFKNVRTIAGNFLDTDLPLFGLYDKILIYSVIHYLSSKKELICFLSKSLDLLAPGGRLLIGDIPNLNKKYRYEKSSFGVEQSKVWKKKVSDMNKLSNGSTPVDKNLITMDDECYIDIINFAYSQGFESYILPEPDNLPFGKTRDDILIISHD